MAESGATDSSSPPATHVRHKLELRQGGFFRLQGHCAPNMDTTVCDWDLQGSCA